MGTDELAAAVRSGLDPDTARAVRVFMQRLEGKYAVLEAILYGSRARGDYKPESDADLAVILRGPTGARYAVAGDLAGIAFHVMLETGVMVEAMPIWEAEWARPERFSNPALIANILRDGVRI